MAWKANFRLANYTKWEKKANKEGPFGAGLKDSVIPEAHNSKCALRLEPVKYTF